MIEYFHLFTAYWEAGTSSLLVASYIECQELMDLVMQEREYVLPSEGGVLGVSCVEQPRISHAPMPELRPLN